MFNPNKDNNFTLPYTKTSTYKLDDMMVSVDVNEVILSRKNGNTFNLNPREARTLIEILNKEYISTPNIVYRSIDSSIDLNGNMTN